MTYRLEEPRADLGEKFRRIYEGKRWAGRVYYNSIAQRFEGVIGEFTAHGDSPVGAFAEVGAKVLGFKSADDWHEHRTKVQEQARRARRSARRLANSILEGVGPEERISALDAFLSSVVR